MIPGRFTLGTLAFLAMGALCAWADPASATGVTRPISKAWVSPKAAEARSPFTLQLFRTDFGCNSAFANQKVTVKENAIHLSYSVSYNKLLCQDNGYYGPAFKMHGLPSGTYFVYDHRQTDCMLRGTCASIPYPVPMVDTLVVRETQTPSPTFTISPEKAPAGEQFNLQALSHQFSCGTSYSRQSYRLENGRLVLTFDWKTDPAVMCPAVVRPYGPSFRIKPLEPGKYPVWVERPCPVGAQCLHLETYAAGTLVVEKADFPAKYLLSPSDVAAGRDFKLELSSYQFTCVTSFSHKRVRQTDSTIVLSFLAKDDLDIACPMIYKPYGTTFPVEGLNAGRHAVYVERLAPCMVSNPACMMAVVPELAGYIVATDEQPPKTTFVAPNPAKARKPFTLELWSYDFACNSEFSHQSVLVQGRDITLSYREQRLTRIACPAIYAPYKADFRLPALAEGRYRVFAQMLPDCMFIGKPECAVDPLIQRNAIDTLLVKEDVSTRVSLNVFNGVKTPSLVREGSSLRLEMAASKAGVLRVELFSLRGDRLAGAQHHVAGPGTTSLRLKPNQPLKRGLYILRSQLAGEQAQSQTLGLMED